MSPSGIGYADDKDRDKARARLEKNLKRYKKEIQYWRKSGIPQHQIMKWLNADEDKEHDWEGMNSHKMADDSDIKIRSNTSDNKLLANAPGAPDTSVLLEDRRKNWNSVQRRDARITKEKLK